MHESVVWIPAGDYMVCPLNVPAGKSLVGNWSRAYTGEANSAVRLLPSVDVGDEAFLMLGKGARLEGITVDGARGRLEASTAVALSGVNVVRGCDVVGAAVGIAGAYSGVNTLEHCIVRQNVVGVRDVVDSRLAMNYVNANTGSGIVFGAGANDNYVAGNKIEWNGGRGIDLTSTARNIITGNHVDRNGQAGLRLVDNSQLIVTSNQFLRNGGLAEVRSKDDVQIYQNGNRGVTFQANLTQSGRDDDSTGRESPTFALVTQGGSKITYIGNHFDGATLQGVNTIAEGSDVVWVANVDY